MPALALITSLYRAEDHLSAYRQHVLAVRAQCQHMGLAIEIVVVANEPTPAEEKHLRELEHADVRIVRTVREPLYASWNRGIAHSSAPVLGFWNVDDVRYADPLGTALMHFEQGRQLVDGPFWVVGRDGQRHLRPTMFDPANIAPRAVAGTFFLFSRALYEQAGPFDARFRIAGDLEWTTRPAIRQAPWAALDEPLGEFRLHAGNLSNNVNPLEWVEINTILLWREALDQLRPVEPELMRTTWQAWGHTGADLPLDLADWLWGAEADVRYQSYLRERQAHPLVRRLRLALARRGLIRSVEWDAHHR